MFDVASALAYLETTLEMLEQLRRIPTCAPTAFYMSSSGKGQAGLVLARRLIDAGFAMEGVTATGEFHVPVAHRRDRQPDGRASGPRPAHAAEQEIVNDDPFRRPRLWHSDRGRDRGDQLFARTEGIILDPIYTGKAAAGMIAHIREGRYKPDDVLVFVHTGGMPADLHLERTLASGGSDHDQPRFCPRLAARRGVSDRVPRVWRRAARRAKAHLWPEHRAADARSVAWQPLGYPAGYEAALCLYDRLLDFDAGHEYRSGHLPKAGQIAADLMSAT